MKYLCLIAVLSFSYNSFAQLEVKIGSPQVAVEFKKVLYMGYDNPVYISPGKVKSLKVTAINGTIRAADIPGKYYVKPEYNEKDHTTTIVLTGDGFKKEYVYEVTVLHHPQFQFIAPFDELPDIRRSQGIYSYHEPFDIEVVYKIDSFTVELTDSLGLKSVYKNTGPLWNETIKKAISDAKRLTRILVYEIYISDPPRKKKGKISSYLEGYIW